MWRKYDDEFKRQAVKKVIDGQSVVSVAQELGINESLIHKWMCANLLQNAANTPTGQGEVLVGDITYLRLRGGKFCYLACLQDKFTRRIVGWKISARMTAQLVIDVFLQARRGGLIKRNVIKRSRSGQPIRSGRISAIALH